MSSDPATFRLPAGNRFVGLLEYIVVLPILAFVILSFIGAVGFALVEQAGFPGATVLVVALATSLFALTWLVRFAVVDYRRRAGVVVTIDSDSLTINRPWESLNVAYEEVQEVRLVPYGRDARCVLYVSDGSACALPVEVALFSAVRNVMEATLIRRLALNLDETLALGGSFRVREHRSSAWLRMAWGALQLLDGALMMLTLCGIPYGAMRMHRGTLAIRRGWLGRTTDFEVTQDGLRATGSMDERDLHSWAQLEIFHANEAGLVLRFEDGHRVTASLCAENFWVFMVWVNQWWLRSQAERNLPTGSGER